MLKLYGFSKVNAVARGHTRDLRVLWALEEMQLPFELAGMDHPAHDLNTEAYRRLSPFEQIYDLMKWGPTSASCSPARFVWVRSAGGKATLAGLAAEPNKPKILKAPVTVIIGHDLDFAVRFGRRRRGRR
jgi:glutathione S-transferase